MPFICPMREVRVLEKQPDWAPGLTFTQQGRQIVVGRLDGTLGTYPLEARESSAAP